jgi:hypothetical protein
MFYYVIGLFVLFGPPLATMEAILATIVASEQACIQLNKEVDIKI